MSSPIQVEAETPNIAVGALQNPSVDAASEARFVRRCLVVCIFSSIFLQRFGIPAGDDSVALNLLITLVVLLILTLRGSFTLDAIRTTAFFALAAVVSLSTAMNAGMASAPSMALMLIMYAPFILNLKYTEGVFEGCIRAFQTMVLVCAIFGIMQYGAQFFINSVNMFTFNGIVPSEFLLPRFNTANPLTWDSPYYKSNGFFLLEPSTFSQYLAIAVLIEILFFKVGIRLFIFFLAIPTSYSGTGLILLLCMLPWAMVSRRAYGTIVVALAFGLFAVVAGSFLNFDALLNRINEFQSANSSANARFIAGAWLIGEFLLSSAGDVIFGLGPGSYAQHARLVPYEAHDPAWAKMLFEYGLLGSAVFWPFFLVSLFRGSPSGWISTAMLIGFFTFGGMLLDPRLQILILAFCVWPKRVDATAELDQPNWTTLSRQPAL